MTTLRPTRARAAGVLTAITMTALLAACSADSSGGDSAGAPGGGGDAGSGSTAEIAPGARGDAGATASDAAATDDLGGAEEGPVTPDLERAVVSTGTVSLVSEDVGATRREVQRVVDAQGGRITDETTETDAAGAPSYSRLVVRVPSARFGAAMTALEEAGELRSADRTSDDVTTEVIDTGARVRAQEASLRRVETLLGDADDLKDIIWIESQLTSRQAELDSLRSQQSWLRDQTSLSTITVDIAVEHGVEDEPEDAPDEPAGFLAGLRGGTDALVTVLGAVATVVGALLPFATVALVLGAPVWLLVRRRRATTPASTPDSPPASPTP